MGPGLRQRAVTSVSLVCQAEDGKRPCGVAAGMSQRGGEVGVAGQAQRADGEVAQAGHHPGEAAGARGGGVFAEVHVADGSAAGSRSASAREASPPAARGWPRPGPGW